MTQCNHDDDTKSSEFLNSLDFLGYEIYLCECGALINIQDQRRGPNIPMNKTDIDTMIANLETKIRNEIIERIKLPLDKP